MVDQEEADGRRIPFPFDHFFFCFLPPVAAGAMISDVKGDGNDQDGVGVLRLFQFRRRCEGLARGGKSRVAVLHLFLSRRPPLS